MGKADGRKERKGRLAFLRLLWAVIFLWGGLLSVAPLPGYGQELARPRVAVQEYPWEETHADPEDYVNPDTGYRVVVEDRARLLYSDQLQELSRAMRVITAYGNAAFVTVGQNEDSTEGFARSYYQERFGTDSGTVFVIDMEQRNIWIHSDGAIWKVITVANANTITDNVYRYASYGDYYQCAAEAFRQIHRLLKGKEIPRPMKYISNALFAVILSLLINYMLFIHFTRLRRPKANAVLANMNRKFNYRKLDALYTHQTRVYDPVSRGGGHGGGIGGGGGGGRSGGGGGHGF